MTKIVVSEFVTLDGVMQAPGSSEEDRSDGFDRGGWQLQFFDDKFGEYMEASFGRTGALLLGRKTYDIFASYWPTAGDDPIADVMNGFRKYVVSRTLKEPLSWQNSSLISGDVPAELRKLKEKGAAGKDIVVIGSGGLVQTLVQNDLVDEFQLMIHPIVLGKGKRLFRDPDAQVRLKLVESTITPNGVVLTTYVPDR
jgi:dihydrofolate reductase